MFDFDEITHALDAGTLKASVPPARLFSALQCLMLSQGVGSGFVSSAHGDREADPEGLA